MNNKDQNLKVELSDGLLTISVGTDVLQHAIKVMSSVYGSGEIRITNEEQFLKGFVRQLENEKEDGSTLIHHALDEAFSEMMENGEDGVEYIDETEE